MKYYYYLINWLLLLIIIDHWLHIRMGSFIFQAYLFLDEEEYRLYSVHWYSCWLEIHVRVWDVAMPFDGNCEGGVKCLIISELMNMHKQS